MKKLIVMALSLSSLLFVAGCNFCGGCNSNKSTNASDASIVESTENNNESCCSCGDHHAHSEVTAETSQVVEGASEVALEEEVA
jgi:hypothetical protein